MKMRLLIVVLIVVTGIAYYVLPKGEEDNPNRNPERDTGTPIYETLLSQRDLPGEAPDVPPDLSIDVAIDRISGKDGLTFTINDANGYYVETFKVDFWYSEIDPDTGEEHVLLELQHYENNYLQANDTLQFTIQIVPAELDFTGGTMGDDENWHARISSYGRARMEDPDPLPPRTREEWEAVKDRLP